MNFILLIFFSLCGYTRALSVKEVVGLAESYSPRLKSEGMSLEAAGSRIRQARTLSNPILTYQGGGLNSGNFTGAVTDITLNQPLPWPGKRSARIEAQEFLRKLSEVSLEEARLEVTHRVYLLSAELAALQELQSHYSERKRRFSLIQTSLRSRPQASPKQQVERDLIESQITIMEKQMLDLELRKSALLWELRVFTHSDFDAIAFDWRNLPEALPKGNYLNALPSSPQGKRMGIEERLSETRIKEARLEARPDIMVGINYRQENVAPVNHFYHGQVSIVIPIVDRGQHSVETAKAEQRKVSALHQLTRDELESSIHRFYADYEANQKAIQVFELNNLNRIEKKFTDAEVSFRKGFIDAITFLQIDSQVHENIDQIFLTRYNYLSALSQLNLLIGNKPEL